MCFCLNLAVPPPWITAKFEKTHLLVKTHQAHDEHDHPERVNNGFDDSTEPQDQQATNVEIVNENPEPSDGQEITTVSEENLGEVVGNNSGPTSSGARLRLMQTRPHVGQQQQQQQSGTPVKTRSSQTNDT